VLTTNKDTISCATENERLKRQICRSYTSGYNFVVWTSSTTKWYHSNADTAADNAAAPCRSCISRKTILRIWNSGIRIHVMELLGMDSDQNYSVFPKKHNRNL